MTPARQVDAAKIRRELGVTRKVFARITGYSERSIASWESGKKPSAPASQSLNEVARLTEALEDVIKPEFIAGWLEEPNEALEGLKPLEVIERGEVDRLWRMIYYLESGVPST
jgi:transcriptional regulator with XRE-family HTH domain